MDVGFPSGELEQLDLDALLQTMDTEHNALNAECNSKRRQIIDERLNRLAQHLVQEHPGLDIPVDGPYFQFMMNSMEEFATLLLEIKDLDMKIDYWRDIMKGVTPSIFDLEKTRGQSRTMDQLQDIGNRLDEVAQARLDLERDCWKLIEKYEKLLDMADMIDDAGEDEDDDAVLLRILRKGIVEVNRIEWGLKIKFLKRKRGLWELERIHDNHLWKPLTKEIKRLRGDQCKNDVILWLFVSLTMFCVSKLFKQGRDPLQIKLESENREALC